MKQSGKIVDSKALQSTMGNKMMQKAALQAITPANFPTNSKKNKDGEIINPTKKDVANFNSRFTTIKKPQLSQRDQYERAMNRAQKNGGSNGVGVGY